MENRYESKWSAAAKDGLILAAVTVVCTLISAFLKTPWLGSILTLVKLVGSIWVLRVIMLNYGKARPSETTFGYGFLVCLFSSIVCAVWSFVLYEFITPGTYEEAMLQAQEMLSGYGQEMTEEFDEAMALVGDNFSKISSITTFLWCTFLGLIFSAILSSGTSRNKDIFADSRGEEDDDE
ncbi:MAG: DUF4199 domain-containing protein [Bacteroidales bacterium]|nr:DUF4199 domain-containing protein [Candidatus Cacconaster merdequi]